MYSIKARFGSFISYYFPSFRFIEFFELILISLILFSSLFTPTSFSFFNYLISYPFYRIVCLLSSNKLPQYQKLFEFSSILVALFSTYFQISILTKILLILSVFSIIFKMYIQWTLKYFL